MDYLGQVASIIAISLVASLGLNIAFGEAGLLSLCQAALMGAGAYAFSAVFRLTDSLLLSVLAGVAAGALIGLLASFASWRLGEVYFALVTFGLQLILSSLFRNLDGITGGPIGLTGLPIITVPGVLRMGQATWSGLVLCGVAFLAYLWALAIRGSGMGRLLWGVREDAKLLGSLGKDPQRAMTTGVVISGTFAGIAGVLYVFQFGYIQPSAFGMMNSLMLLAIVVVGGAGSRYGVLVGTLLVMGIPELLRFVGSTTVQIAQLREILFGLLLVLCVRFWPKGVAGGVDLV